MDKDSATSQAAMAAVLLVEEAILVDIAKLNVDLSVSSMDHRVNADLLAMVSMVSQDVHLRDMVVEDMVAAPHVMVGMLMVPKDKIMVIEVVVHHVNKVPKVIVHSNKVK